MAWKWYDSHITRIADESPTTKRFWLEISGDEPFDFKAGQFITMDLPISDKRLKRWRSYSIANAPDPGSRELEFCIVQLNGGSASHYLFEEAAVGTSVRFKGPDGNFCLPEVIQSDIVMICTGTGIAPFRSMLLDIVKRGIAHRRIHLIFGCRKADSILYREEMEQLCREIPQFSYSVALSREEQINPDDFSFEVCKGYVHQIYMHQYEQARPDVHFYLCGWSNMIDDAVANLIVKLGYDRTQVHYELYG